MKDQIKQLALAAPITATEMARKLDTTVSIITHHAEMLERAGIIGSWLLPCGKYRRRYYAAPDLAQRMREALHQQEREIAAMERLVARKRKQWEQSIEDAERAPSAWHMTATELRERQQATAPELAKAVGINHAHALKIVHRMRDRGMARPTGRIQRANGATGVPVKVWEWVGA